METYDKFTDPVHKNQNQTSLMEIFPAMEKGISAGSQAVNQFLAMLCTLAFAVFGGLITGLIMHLVGKLDPVADDHLYNDKKNIANLDDESETLVELEAFMGDTKNGVKVNV